MELGLFLNAIKFHIPCVATYMFFSLPLFSLFFFFPTKRQYSIQNSQLGPVIIFTPSKLLIGVRDCGRNSSLSEFYPSGMVYFIRSSFHLWSLFSARCEFYVAVADKEKNRAYFIPAVCTMEHRRKIRCALWRTRIYEPKAVLLIVDSDHFRLTSQGCFFDSS